MIRPIRVSHLGIFGEFLHEERRREEEEEEEKKKKRISCMYCYNFKYGLLWISMNFFTFVWLLVCSISRV